MVGEASSSSYERWFFPVSTLFLSSDLIVLLGRISYQTYLWHVPIIVWSDAACKGGFNSECSAKAIGAVLFIYLFSAFISRCFEYPMQAFILARKNPRLVIAGMFATMLALAGLICVVTRNYEDPYAYVEKENSMRQFTDDAVTGRIAPGLHEVRMREDKVDPMMMMMMVSKYAVEPVASDTSAAAKPTPAPTLLPTTGAATTSDSRGESSPTSLPSSSASPHAACTFPASPAAAELAQDLHFGGPLQERIQV